VSIGCAAARARACASLSLSLSLACVGARARALVRVRAWEADATSVGVGDGADVARLVGAPLGNGPRGCTYRRASGTRMRHSMLGPSADADASSHAGVLRPGSAIGRIRAWRTDAR
jgi:hypothetical protein